MYAILLQANALWRLLVKAFLMLRPAKNIALLRPVPTFAILLRTRATSAPTRAPPAARINRKPAQDAAHPPAARTNASARVTRLCATCVRPVSPGAPPLPRPATTVVPNQRRPQPPQRPRPRRPLPPRRPRPPRPRPRPLLRPRRPPKNTRAMRLPLPVPKVRAPCCPAASAPIQPPRNS